MVMAMVMVMMMGWVDDTMAFVVYITRKAAYREGMHCLWLLKRPWPTDTPFCVSSYRHRTYLTIIPEM